MDFAAKLRDGLSYTEFLEAHATPEQKRRWTAVFDAVKLTDAQRALLGSFTRDMPVFCLAGAWCGDCVNQCPIFARFAEAAPRISLKFYDRDAHPDLALLLRMCGGARVPMLLFLSEDFQEVGRFGDRTLSQYRKLASGLMGAACPSGLVAPESSTLATITAEWLEQFERAQWVLRTSSRLRGVHGD
jgi:hypothetical protein